VPAIRLVEKGGKLSTLDNRRLAAFQQAGVAVSHVMATVKEAHRRGVEVHNEKRRHLHPHPGTMTDITTDSVDEIASRADFISFLQAMQSELDEHPEEWENRDLKSFLAAAAAWVEDMDGFFLGRGEDTPSPDWRAVAHMLAAARHYE
jgi:hypothetical protein